MDETIAANSPVQTNSELVGFDDDVGGRQAHLLRPAATAQYVGNRLRASTTTTRIHNRAQSGWSSVTPVEYLSVTNVSVHQRTTENTKTCTKRGLISRHRTNANLCFKLNSRLDVFHDRK